jgi:hypothetical protein
MFCAVISHAQDLIIQKNGDPIKAYNIEVGSKHLFYQLENDSNANIIRIPKNDVLMIRKTDGSMMNLTNSTSNEVEEEDDGFPIIPEDSIKGSLIAEGNCVFVPTDSPDNYERAGQETLKAKIKEWGYWNVVNKPEKSHFILQFITDLHGGDTSWLIFQSRNDYRKTPTIQNKNTDDGLQIVFTRSSENIEDNKLAAEKLFTYFQGLTMEKGNKEYKKVSGREVSGFFKPQFNMMFDSATYGGNTNKWKPRYVLLNN